MLAFIIPLQSPLASNNWPRVSMLATRCLASILAQTNPDFKVVLVCNELPVGFRPDPRVTILQRDFPLPGKSSQARMEDKWLKVRYGLAALRQIAPCHVMVVDADDLVSNRLAGHVAKYPDANGWIFETGLLHDEGSKLIYQQKKDFHLMCGTSSIIRLERDDLPLSEQDETRSCLVLRSGHRLIEKEMERIGKPLFPLAFPGAIYILGTGENDSGFSLKGWRSKRVLLQKLLNYRFVSSCIRQEFGLYGLDKPQQYEHSK